MQVFSTHSESLDVCVVIVPVCPSGVRLGAGAVVTAHPAVVVLRHGQLVRVLGLRGRGCWDRRDHPVYVQYCAIQRELVATRSGAVVLGAYSLFRGRVFVGAAGGAAVSSDAASGHRDDVAPIQVGGFA